MSGLTAAEVLSMQEENILFFTDLCDIYTASPAADDAYGGTTVVSEAATQTGVQCMIESGAAQEQTRAMLAKISGVQIFTITLPAGTEIEVGDHIMVTTQSNMHLRVQAVMAPESYELERKVIANVLGEHNA